ncbi:MAG: hypothetical protein M3Y13_05220, partial [Armatimonadota bacterium]|nr:hypothetical protein [Armatimonadota bacterium]
GILTISAIVGGQTRTATLTVTVAPGTSYPAGLSMISSPYDYSGQPLSAVFGITGVKLAVWQPGAGIYAYTPNAPADTLRPGQGYWVRLTKAATLATAGTPADPTTDFPIALQAGWNQIGDPFLVPITLGNVHVSSGSATATFAQAAAGTPPMPLLVSGLVYSYSSSAGSGKGAYLLTRSDGSLQPGMGYWIYAYQPVTLIIPHPGQ